MKNVFKILTIVMINSTCGITLAQNAQQPMLLWFDRPAYQPDIFSYKADEFTMPYKSDKKGWFEALPIGNGKLGAMVFGGTLKERIQLNEETLWDGYKMDAINYASSKSLPEVQRLVFDGKVEQAEALASKTMLGIPKRIRPYQSLGDLFIEFKGNDLSGEAVKFKRWLSLDSALTVTRFTYNGKKYKREVFASNPAQVIIIRFSCDQPASINLNIRLLREQDASTMPYSNDPKRMLMKGRINCLDEKQQPAGLHFVTHVKAINSGGKVSVDKDGVMKVSETNELVLILAAATSYQQVDPDAYCNEKIVKASATSYATLLQQHVADHRSLFNRVKIQLSPKENAMELPQDRRMERVATTKFNDPYLSSLLFQYGRYLLIASSRKGDLPANLQGIWNSSMRPPWESDYHTNINLQMNYMAAEVVNLRECHQPLFDLIDSVAYYGKRTAREMYNANGWVVHHLTNIFWRTEPASGLVGVWPMGGGWLSRHLFEHYLYSGDKTFLHQRAYPVMKSAAEFLLDFLKPVPEGLPFAGKLVTNPSHSPENAFEDDDGKQYQSTYGATMDMEICYDLFSNCLQAIELLSSSDKQFDATFKKRLEEALSNLLPIQISERTGGIQEWVKDYKEPEIGHRHISHLYALFPSNQINSNTPELYEAARKTLERRLQGNPNAAVEEAKNKFKSYDSYVNGESKGGWLSNWVSMMWVRLGNAEEAYKHHLYQLKNGMLLNMFCNYYQLDGTFGSTAVVAEMLLQSHEGYIQMFPALPKAWNNGSFTGLLARGNFEISAKWISGSATQIKVLSRIGGLCKMKYNNIHHAVIKNSRNEIVKVNTRNTDIIEFNTVPGETYVVTQIPVYKKGASKEN